MNKLTTIKTITKAVPLALLAVVMSGSAFAGNNSNNGSINVTNDCSIDPDTKELVVRSTITDESGDGDNAAAVLDTISVTGKFKARKGPWWTIGSPDVDQAYIGPNTAAFPLCTGLADGATVLNAEIDVIVLNSRRGPVTKSSKCDDDPTTYCFYYDGDGNEVVYYCEEEDESNVDVPDDLCD